MLCNNNNWTSQPFKHTHTYVYIASHMSRSYCCRRFWQQQTAELRTSCFVFIFIWPPSLFFFFFTRAVRRMRSAHAARSLASFVARQWDAYKIVVWRQTRFSRLTEFQLAGQKKSSWRAYGNWSCAQPTILPSIVSIIASQYRVVSRAVPRCLNNLRKSTCRCRRRRRNVNNTARSWELGCLCACLWVCVC